MSSLPVLVSRPRSILQRAASLFGSPAPAPVLIARIEPTLTALPVVKRHRGQRGYAGADVSRLTADWNPFSTSFDGEVRSGLRTLRNRSRQLIRDNEYGKRIKTLVKNNVVGQGVKFQSSVQKRNKALHDDANDAAGEAFEAWCKKDNCSVAGKWSFSEIQRLVMGEVPESGEQLIRLIRGQYFGASKVPFALELISADQLAEDYSGRTNAGNEIRMGVEMDKWKRPVAYWLRTSNSGDITFIAQTSTQLQRVPATEIIHLFVPENSEQTRGVPWMHAAMRRLNDVGGYDTAEIVRARAAASRLGFIQSQDGDPNDSPNADGNDGVEDGQRVTDMEPGMIRHLAPGETWVGSDAATSNPGIEVFMRYMLRAVFVSVGVSYASGSGDYSQSNYSSSRLSLLDERDTWRAIQQWFVDHFLQPIYEAWLEMAVLAGVLRFPDYETNTAKYQKVRWLTRGWDWVDPLKDITAAKMAIRTGLDTQQGVLADRNSESFEDICRQRAKEIEIAKEYGLVFDTDPAQILETGETVAGADPAGGDDDAAAANGKPAGGKGDDDEAAGDAADPKRVYEALERVFARIDRLDSDGARSPVIHVAAPAVTVAPPAVHITLPAQSRGAVRKTITAKRDADGNLVGEVTELDADADH